MTFINQLLQKFSMYLEEVTREQRSHAKTVNFELFTGYRLLAKPKPIFLAQKALL
jgi:hypothetical protein